MFADANDPSSLNYHPCRYGDSKISFRGPKRRIKGDYIAFLGGSETYGRFIKQPYPVLIESILDVPAINLGCVKGGIDAFNTSQGLIDICSMAQITVVEVMGAAYMSNRFYTVDPRHNDRFVRASKRFKGIFPEVDFSTFSLIDEMLVELAAIGLDRVKVIRQEIQSAWVARMRTLLGQIDGKKVLLWMSDHAPYSAAKGGTICRSPVFVDRKMLTAVTDYADALVEITARPREIADGRADMLFSTTELDEAKDMLGPVVHQRVSKILAPLLAALMHDLPMPTTSSDISLAS